jgi:LPS-assembly protein
MHYHRVSQDIPILSTTSHMTSAPSKLRNLCSWSHSAAGKGVLAIAISTVLLAMPARAQDSRLAAPAANSDETTASSGAPTCIENQAFLDWQAKPAAPADPADPADPTQQRGNRCGGTYIDPLAGLDTSVDPSQQEIEASATQSEMQDGMVRLSGGVQAQQGYRQLRADEAEFDQDNQSGSLHGNVELREPGLLLRGATGTINTDTGEAQLTANQFVFHDLHIHGGADLARRRSDNVIELDDAYYSYCPPLADQWMLFAEHVELDFEEGIGTARKAKIELGGVPIIYTPYFRFPLDERRKSGFLWPEIGTDSNGGADIAAPYYFNLAPNYDATLTPRYINERGLLTELETRYLGENTGLWEVGGAWIGGDDEYQSDFPEEDGDRWLAAVAQQGLFAQRWRTEIDFTNISDDYYFSDLGTTSLQVVQSTHLAQRGRVNYLGDDWQAEVRVEGFKTIARDVDTDAYSKLPQISLRRSAIEQDFSPNLLLTSDYSYFDHDTDITGHRLYNSVGVSYPMNWIWGYLKPEAKYRQINYDLDESVFFDQGFEDTPDVGAPLIKLDGGLYFERDTGWGLQTLEPQLYYLWADYEEQLGLPDFDTSELTFAYSQLFRETRFSGKDRLDDANQVSVVLTSRFIDPASGREKLTVSLGQIYYFDDRRVNVDAASESDFEGSSAIAAEFNVSPIEELEFRSSWLWNTDEDKLDQTYLQMGYRGPNQLIVNLGYSYRRYRGNNPDSSDIDQVDFSTYLPVNQEWSLFLRSLYDLEESERINDMAGIEYNSCCWRVRLVYQRFLDQKKGVDVNSLVEYEHATYLQFQLKGLGGVGTRVSSMLEEFIRGYEDSED